MKTIPGPNVRVDRWEKDGCIYTKWQTPKGEVTHIDKRTWDSWIPVKHPIENVDDLRIMEYVIREEQYEFDPADFEHAVSELGDRIAPTLIIGRINLQRLFLDHLGYEETIYLLHDYPQEMETLICALDEAYDRFCAVAKDAPYNIVNFGDNVHSDMLPPPLFEKYVLPRYQKISVLFQESGKFCYPHWDGNVKTLLPYVQSCGFDGVEAITFEPQGDVSIKETKAAMGDTILIDGIPAIYFLPQYPESLLEECTREVIETFKPNLILGVSDELPPGSDIERCRLVSRIVAEYNRK
ncbi:MAG: uroporphyrinogen decarboxylase family protein [bacterium]